MKRLFSFALAMLFLMLSTITAYAETPANPYIQTAGYVSIMNGASPIIFRNNTTGMPAYCLDYNRGIPSPESLSGEFDAQTIFDPATYKGLQSLLLAGYPFETGGLTNDEAQACTQLAVWCWTYETMGYGLDASGYSALSGRENVYNFFKGLLEAARNQTPPDIDISCNDIFMAIDGNILTGSTTVSLYNLQTGYALDESVLPEGISVLGYTGNDGDVLTFTAPLSYAGNSFVIENALLGQDTRSALNLFWYDNSNPSQQRMVITAMDETVTAVQAGLSFSFEDMGKIVLTKLAEKTNNPLAGAVFGVYDTSTDEKVAEITTDESGEASIELGFGEYYLVELVAPVGFTLSNEKYPISLGQTEIGLTVTNPQSVGTVKIVKTGEDGERLSGVVFDLYDANTDEKLMELTSDENGTASQELPLGGYYLTETATNEGYVLLTDNIPFVLTDQWATLELTIENQKILSPENGKVTLIKQADGTGENLSGAVFGVYDATTNEKLTEITTDGNGVATFELPQGDYYLLELVAPVGFKLNADQYAFRLNEGEAKTITIINSPEDVIIPEPGSVTIIKKSDNGTLLSGTVFGIYNVDTDEKLTEITTGADGTATFELPQGDYYLLELVAPVGFKLNADQFAFKINDGESKEITVIDVPEDVIISEPEPGNMIVIKKSDSGAFLPGAVFGVYNADTDEKLVELTTGSNGVTSGAALTVGDYYLIELQAPTGYKLNADRYNFSMSESEAKEITIINVLEDVPVPTPTPGKLLIIKKADGTGEKLKDAVFGVYRTTDDEKIAELATNEYGEAMTELPAGEYYLRELQAPQGYKLTTDRIKVSIKSDATKEITVTNKLEPTVTPPPTEKPGKLLIIKKADSTGEKLKDATFGVYRSSDDKKVAELTTDLHGEAKTELPTGEYYLREFKAPSGYKLTTDKIKVSIKSDATKEIIVTNKLEQTVTPPQTETPGKLVIIKKADGTGEKLKDATFGVYRSSDDTKLTELTTNRYGEASLELPVGNYYLRELKAPTGYKLSTDRISIKIKSGETKEITVTNKAETPVITPTSIPTPTPTPIEKIGTLQLIKSAEGTGKRLSGAVFGVYEMSSNKQIAEITSGNDGTATLEIPLGDYYLKEIKAPVGFKLETAKILFTVKENAAVKVEVTNMLEKTVQPTPENTPSSSITIPKTGEAFPTTNYIMATLCLGLALLCAMTLFRLKRRVKFLRI